MAGLDFKLISSALSCRDFAAAGELPILRNGRSPCPFHNGKDGNLSYLPDGHCHCFVCGRSGDVVTLAAAVWRVSQLDAARELNVRFHLGIADKPMTATELAAHEAARAREREQSEAQAEAERAEWSAAADELREAEDAAGRLTLDDAETDRAWEIIARLGRAQDAWNALQAGWTTTFDKHT